MFVQRKVMHDIKVYSICAHYIDTNVYFSQSIQVPFLECLLPHFSSSSFHLAIRTRPRHSTMIQSKGSYEKLM